MKKIVQPLINEIHLNTEQYLSTNIVQPINFTGYQNYLTSGNRLTFENEYFARRRQLSVLSLDYLNYPANTTRILLENVIWEICNEYTWGLPPHMPITDDTFGLDSPFWIDLFAAETSETLAEIQELLGDHLTPQINQRIDEEIERRIFKPFEGHDWSWQYKDNNWSAVIASCIGITALLKLPRNSNRQKKLLKRLNIAFESYLKSFGDDGACVEGVSYWAYGFGYYIYFADKVKQILGNTRYLDISKVRKIAQFPFYTELAANSYLPFSDAANIELPTGLLSYCQDQFQINVPEYDHVNRLDFDNCYRFAQLYRDLIWTNEYHPINIRSTRTHYFSDVQWFVERSDTNNFVFAAKGGANNESHNHIDLGHFILGTPLHLYLTDLGAGEYTKDYFNNDKRYNYLTPSAAGHSIPTINGHDELFGDCLSTSHFDELDHTFTLNLTKTYSHEIKLNLFTRQFEIIAEERYAKLTDNFEFDHNKNTVQEHFITTIKPVINNNKILLSTNDETCTLTFDTNKIEFKKLTYSDHNADLQTVFRITATYCGDQSITIKIGMKILKN